MPTFGPPPCAPAASSCVQTALQRLDTLEFMRLPQLQERAEEAARRWAGGVWGVVRCGAVLS